MCRDRSHSGRRCPGQTSRPHRRAATALLTQEAEVEPAVAASIYRAIASDVARTVNSGISATRKAINHITQQIRSHIMSSNTLSDAQKRALSDRITRRMSAEDMTTRQVTIWSRVLDALRKIRTAGVVVGTAAVLAACGGGEEPTDYLTPTVAPSTSSGAPTEETPAGEASVVAPDAPMGINPSSVTFPVEHPWSEAQAANAVADTMSTVEVAQSLVNVQGVHDSEDARLYEPLRARMTADAYASLEAAVREPGDDSPSVSALVAGTNADGTITHPETGATIDVDRVVPAFNTPTYWVSQDSALYGDDEARLVMEGTVENTYAGADRASGDAVEVTFRRTYQYVYLPGADDHFDLAGWSAETTLA